MGHRCAPAPATPGPARSIARTGRYATLGSALGGGMGVAMFVPWQHGRKQTVRRTPWPGNTWSDCCRLPEPRLGFPQRPPGRFAGHQIYFSTDVTCQKLRNDIIGIMERNVPPETKRSLLKKEVVEFDKLCGEGDPDARTIFQAAMAE